MKHPLYTLLLNVKWEARIVIAMGSVYLNSPHPNGAAINQPSENPGLHDTEVGVVSGPAGPTRGGYVH